MSHELRSPLNAMLGFSRLLIRDAELGERARRDVTTVLRSGEQLYELINQVLELSKIEAGRMSLHPSLCDLPGLLQTLREMFSLAARDKGLELTFGAALDVPRLVEVDAGKLRQVLTNLLSNAIKFTVQGRVTLHVRRVDERRLGFSVEDTGVGVSPSELRTLGDTFVQAHAGTQAAEGTGLGLAICRNFVRLMGGELELNSAPGQGLTARFSVEVEMLAQPALAPAPVSPRAARLAHDGAAPRILVVDDRPEGRELLVRILQPQGFEVREAANGLEAIEVWTQWQPQLICMDMRMPVLDGREATRRIKASSQGRQTVIVAVTASSFEEQRDEILAAGCDELLRKPFQEEALLQMLARHLNLRLEQEALMPEECPGTSDGACLAAVPGTLREALRNALERLDVHAVEQALQAVREHDEQAASVLAPGSSSLSTRRPSRCWTAIAGGSGQRWPRKSEHGDRCELCPVNGAEKRARQEQRA
jgi:CheY-like chemotaxis protein